MNEINYNELSLDELSDMVRSALSTIYNKLREEENFSWDQHCVVENFGGEEYEVRLVIINGTSGTPSIHWPETYYI